MIIQGGERVFWACFTAFLGFVIAFGGMPIVGSFTNWDPQPQILWFAISAPVLTIGGFALTWRLTRP